MKIRIAFLVIATIVIVLAIVFTDDMKSARSRHFQTNIKVTTSVPFRSPFASLKIDIKKGHTEIEKTLLIKYNNLITIFDEAYKEPEKVTWEDDSRCMWLINDLDIYILRNEISISKQLLKDIETKLETLSKYLEQEP